VVSKMASRGGDSYWTHRRRIKKRVDEILASIARQSVIADHELPDLQNSKFRNRDENSNAVHSVRPASNVSDGACDEPRKVQLCERNDQNRGDESEDSTSDDEERVPRKRKRFDLIS